MKLPLNFLIVFLLVILVGPIQASQWDSEYWQSLTVKNWEKGSCKLYTAFETRLNRDHSRFNYYRISENFAYQALPDLSFEAHYSFLYSKSHGASRFLNSNRLEFEMNPSLNLSKGIVWRWRNRLELIKRQGISPIRFVFRHRFMTVFSIKSGPLSSVNVYDEFHYDFSTKKITQNRFVPIELSFIVNRYLSIDLFFMIRNFFTSNQWYRSMVAGSEINF